MALKIFMVLIGKFRFLYSVSAHKHWTIGVANLRKERSSMADIYQNLFKTERCMVKSEQVRTGNKVTGPAFGPKVFSSMPQINGQLILELLLNASCAR